jgi:hypothetical protein
VQPDPRIPTPDETAIVETEPTDETEPTGEPGVAADG